MSVVDDQLVVTAQAIDLAIERSIEDPERRDFVMEFRRLSASFASVSTSLSKDDIRTTFIYVMAFRVLRAKALRMASGHEPWLDGEDEVDEGQEKARISRLVVGMAMEARPPVPAELPAPRTGWLRLWVEFNDWLDRWTGFSLKTKKPG